MSSSDRSRNVANGAPPVGSDAYAAWLERMQRTRGRHAAITKNLADELGPKGVNVVAVHPGATRTERTDEAAAQRAAEGNTIGRIVESEEIAYLVAFLASPKSAAINGAAIPAGGGVPGTINY